MSCAMQSMNRLSEQKQAELDLAKRLFEKLMSSLSSLADATGLDLLPELQVHICIVRDSFKTSQSLSTSKYLYSCSVTLSLFVYGVAKEEAEEEDGVGGISLWDGGGGAGQDYGPWGDAETKAFYEELPGLWWIYTLSNRVMLSTRLHPMVLLG